jgi:hypothetical protein
MERRAGKISNCVLPNALAIVSLIQCLFLIRFAAAASAVGRALAALIIATARSFVGSRTTSWDV